MVLAPGRSESVYRRAGAYRVLLVAYTSITRRHRCVTVVGWGEQQGVGDDPRPHEAVSGQDSIRSRLVAPPGTIGVCPSAASL